MKFRKKEYIVEAMQWFRHGDHPSVFAVPEDKGGKPSQIKKFGWLRTSMGGHQITAGDWIIRNPNGEISSCNPLTFERLYEPYEEKSPLLMKKPKSIDQPA